MATLTHSSKQPPAHRAFLPNRLLTPLRCWLETLPIQTSRQAHLICRLIPGQCPFERDLTFLGRTLLHIPPLCKLNPFYTELLTLRFRALTYLADVCQEDITPYCREM